MLKLKREDTDLVMTRLQNSKDPLKEFLDEISKDQGEEYAAQVAVVGLREIGYLFGMLSMYFTIKNAMIRSECEDLDRLFKKEGAV